MIKGSNPRLSNLILTLWNTLINLKHLKVIYIYIKVSPKTIKSKFWVWISEGRSAHCATSLRLILLPRQAVVFTGWLILTVVVKRMKSYIFLSTHSLMLGNLLQKLFFKNKIYTANIYSQRTVDVHYVVYAKQCANCVHFD